VRFVPRADQLRVAAAFLVVLAAGLAIVLLVAARPDTGAAAGQPAVPAPQAGLAAAAGPVVPAQLTIPAIGVDAPVESRGTVRYKNAFTGDMVDGYGVPESMHTTSWWSDGPRPGSGEMAVILGHEQAVGGAVFDRLEELRAGDEVALRDSGGAVLRLQVLGAPLTGLDKSTSALSDALNGHPDGAAVALVTCGGEFDSDVGASKDNTVVFAALAG
jgi:hypothetical protein